MSDQNAPARAHSVVTPLGARLGFAALALATLLLGGRADAAAPANAVKAVVESSLVAAPAGEILREDLTLDAELPAALLRVPIGGKLQVTQWPIAPGQRRTATLTRHEIYSPDARIFRIGPEGETEVPRSRLAFFLGNDGGGSHIAISVDPDSGSVRDMTISEAGIYELTPSLGPLRRYRLAPPEAETAGEASRPSWSCGTESLEVPAPAPAGRASSIRPAAAESFTKSAVVAIDTDNELMLNKFGNDTTAAVNYLATLFANMNVIYERDVSVHLLEGYTILRVSTVADPYNQNGSGNADGNKLSEFSNYWATNYSAVQRTVTAMISGKQPGSNSASGIAWIGGLCSSGFGYSFNQIFQINYLAGDTLIVAHEIGHNFGSPHTHCYSPPADTCYNLEACYSGPTSCPASQTINGVPNVTGTLMGYCHLSGIPNCGTSLVFHPRTISEYFTSHITSASACIFNVGSLPPGPTVSGIAPPSGVLSGGTPVTISGANFSGTVTVAFVDKTGSVSVTPGTHSSGSISATTPAHSAGAVDVVVMNSDFQTGTLSNGFHYQAVLAPSVASITPPSGPTAGATGVTITGSNFVSGATVTIGGVAAGGAFVSSTTLTAVTGTHAAGAGDVVVTNPDLQTGTLTAGFTYLSPTNRTFVSARLGNDANACTLALPCRGFARAFSLTSAGGEIAALDSGGYGPFTVTRAVSVKVPSGVYAGITAAAGDGITVSAGVNDVVALDGLTINGAGATVGVNFVSGAALSLSSCTISGFVDGLRATGPGELLVEGTRIRNATNTGVRIAPSSPSRAFFELCRIEGNPTGIYVTGGCRATLRETVLSGNTVAGTACDWGETDLEDCQVVANATGILATGTGTVRVSDSVVTDNGTGLSQSSSGALQSRTNNTVESNSSDISGTITAYVPR